LSEPVDKIERFAGTLAKIQEAIAGLAILIISLLVFVAVLGRYIFAYSIPWNEELSQYLLMLMVYLGTGAVSWRGEHLQADLFGPHMRKGLRKTRDVIFELVMLGLCVYIAIQTFAFAGRIRPINQVSATLRIPHSITIIFYGVGLILMAIMHFFRVWLALRKEENVRKEEKAGAL
jgi:C4-dicarboxylate transporter DctQ subunit